MLKDDHTHWSVHKGWCKLWLYDRCSVSLSVTWHRQQAWIKSKSQSEIKSITESLQNLSREAKKTIIKKKKDENAELGRHDTWEWWDEIEKRKWQNDRIFPTHTHGIQRIRSSLWCISPRLHTMSVWWNSGRLSDKNAFHPPVYKRTEPRTHTHTLSFVLKPNAMQRRPFTRQDWASPIKESSWKFCF